MKILYLLIAVLKFFGIAMLILLLLSLLLIIIILTVPIKYSVYINKSDETYALTSLRWLYSIVGMDIIYESGSEITNSFRLFGKAIHLKKPKKIKKRSVKKSKDQIDIENIPDKKEENKTKKEEQSKTEESPKENPKKIKKHKKTKETTKSNKKTGGFKEVMGQIQSFYYKKQLLADTMSLIGKLFKRIRPSTLYMEIEIGKEDPAETGQLIGMLSALYPIYYSFANIVGNYEKECFYGKLEAKGDITLGKIVYDFIKYIRTTSVKQLIKFVRKNRKGK